ncbi:MAG: PEGA domain-containing protein [Candidatus Deferrimicrobiaceae bacterium]
MRFTSSGRKFLSLLLSLILLRSTGAAPPVLAEAPPEPCILLKLSAVAIPADTVKSGLGALEGLLEENLHIRWVTPVPAAEAGQEAEEAFPVADGKALEAISAALGKAIRHMDRMETKEAAEELSEAERLARSFRFSDTTRPYLAEVFLRWGILSLWEGKAGKAEEMLARSRILRPEFDPDPAMFSPLFLEAWKRSGERPPPQAELLVTSLPPGARIYRNGEEVGRTPGRVRISKPGPVRIRVLAEGYLRSEWAGQMLPGDSDALEFPLVRDRNAALADMLSSSPDGKEAGSLLSQMIVETGAMRVALLLLAQGEEGPVMRVISLNQGEEEPVFLGTIPWPESGEGYGPVAATTVEMLKSAGWPAQTGTDTAKAPWYHKWWFWALVGAAAAGVAVGIGGSGGGGDSGSSTGAIGVNF